MNFVVTDIVIEVESILEFNAFTEIVQNELSDYMLKIILYLKELIGTVLLYFFKRITYSTVLKQLYKIII